MWIPPTYTVSLDVSPPRLNRLVIEGVLVFNNTKDLTLDAVLIDIRGTLRIGSPEYPFLKSAVITLHGDRNTPEVWVGRHPSAVGGVRLGAKAMSVMGKLQLYGAPRTPSWTTLALTAAMGSSEITLLGFVDWGPGDYLSVASTSFNMWEVRTPSALLLRTHLLNPLFCCRLRRLQWCLGLPAQEPLCLGWQLL